MTPRWVSLTLLTIGQMPASAKPASFVMNAAIEDSFDPHAG